jgi:mono/diheme cytochrome c family protein
MRNPTTNNFRKPSLFPAALVAAALLSGPAAGAATYDDLAPILAARCVMCHTGDAAPLGLRLDSYEGLAKGSQKGPVAKSGDPAGSELIRRLKGQSQPRMPMTGPPFLSDQEVALFESWISAGMPKGTAAAKPAVAPAAPARPKPGEQVTYAHVAPILAQRCAKCHAEQGLMGPAPEGYRLTSYEATVSAADRVRVVPGQPLASELVRRLRGWSLPRMPFDGPPFLSEEDIKLIEEWIRQGARDASGNPARMPVGARLRLGGNLGANWTLDGLPLEVGGARIDKAPRPGDRVEVRGAVGPSGSVIVERLRRR